MIENSVFNSSFEIELRVLLLLSSTKKKAFSAERIVALDFITCYASSFDLPYLNLQGDNQYMYTELPGRRERIRESIKHLVVQGMLDVSLDEGYLFRISDSGSKFIKRLKSEYAVDYRKIAADVVKKYKSDSDLALDRMLNDKAVLAVRGGH